MITHLCFEISDTCNLKARHQRCPVNDPTRYDNGFQKEEGITNDDIIGFSQFMIGYGFDGFIAFHNYCEPTLEIRRIYQIIERLNAKFLLWTNGVLLTEEMIDRFDKIVVTNYVNKDIKSNDKIKFIKPGLDNRMAFVEKPGIKLHKCQRVEHEMVIDYYGNIKLCCMDIWGEVKIANIKTHDYECCINEWNKAKFLEYKVCRKCQSSCKKYKNGPWKY